MPSCSNKCAIVRPGDAFLDPGVWGGCMCVGAACACVCIYFLCVLMWESDDLLRLAMA